MSFQSTWCGVVTARIEGGGARRERQDDGVTHFIKPKSKEWLFGLLDNLWIPFNHTMSSTLNEINKNVLIYFWKVIYSLFNNVTSVHSYWPNVSYSISKYKTDEMEHHKTLLTEQTNILENTRRSKIRNLTCSIRNADDTRSFMLYSWSWNSCLENVFLGN